MKIKLLFIGFLILAYTESNGQVERYVNADAKAHCKCFKFYEKKSKKAEKEYNKHRRNSPNAKLFGGPSFDFNSEKCLNQKRDKKLKEYIESLDDREKRQFRRKVKNKIKKNVQREIGTMQSHLLFLLKKMDC